MKFVSLRTKQAHRPSKLATAPAPLTKIHTYAELRQQIHDDLRLQHPEWIQPDGKSPICDSYEARLMELLGGALPGQPTHPEYRWNQPLTSELLPISARPSPRSGSR